MKEKQKTRGEKELSARSKLERAEEGIKGVLEPKGGTEPTANFPFGGNYSTAVGMDWSAFAFLVAPSGVQGVQRK